MTKICVINKPSTVNITVLYCFLKIKNGNNIIGYTLVAMTNDRSTPANKFLFFKVKIRANMHIARMLILTCRLLTSSMKMRKLSKKGTKKME
jgi:hypothetical protein